MDLAEKAKFNNLASEYKEHLMREQPNFSYNKKQPQAQVPVNQSVSTGHPSISSVKPKVESIGAAPNAPSYDPGNRKIVEKRFAEQQGSETHFVQLQQRSGDGEVSQKTSVSIPFTVLIHPSL